MRLLPVLELAHVATGVEEEDEAPRAWGMPFCPLGAVPVDLLVRRVQRRLEDEGGNAISSEDLIPLDGGLAITSEGKPILCPQCCGDLGDVIYWRRVAFEQVEPYHQGHPAPELHLSKGEITFRCHDEYDPFRHSPPDQFRVDCGALQAAYVAMLPELDRFQERVADVVRAVAPGCSAADVARRLTFYNAEMDDGNTRPHAR